MESQIPPLVLMIDGDENVSIPVRRLLEGDGWQFVGVETIAEAQRMITARRPDLLIIDLTVHHAAGVALARESRAAGMLVIVLPDRSPTALAGLAWPYLPKPFQPEDLTTLARTVLESPSRPRA